MDCTSVGICLTAFFICGGACLSVDVYVDRNIAVKVVAAVLGVQEECAVTHPEQRNISGSGDAVDNKHTLAVRAFILNVLGACTDKNCG